MTRLPPLLVLALLALCAPCRQAEAEQDDTPAPQVPAAEEQDWASEQTDVAIPMRDGAELAADLYLPEKPGAYPAVLIQTPYDKSRLGAPIAGEERPSESGRGAQSDMLGLLDRENYAYVIVDWRGFFGSKAAMRKAARRTWKRGQDGCDCVEWVAGQSWCNGKVGTWGGSALGVQQFETAAEKPEHLVCCVPLIAAMGQSYEKYYAGGILLEGHVKRMETLGFGVSQTAMAHHDPDDPFWKLARRATFRPEAVEVPCLLITGWWDNFPAQIVETFEALMDKAGEAARKHSRLLIGPWDHVSIGLSKQGDLEFAGAELESARAAKAFLDYHLRNEVDNGWDETPRARYWQVGEGWRETERWSATPRENRTLYAHADRRLSGEAPAAATEDEPLRRSYRYDPKNAPATPGGANLPPMKHGPCRLDDLRDRDDVLSYSTGVLEEPLEIDGEAEMALSFVIDRVDADFAAWLCMTDGDGRTVMLAEACARARYREGKSTPVKPGDVCRLSMRFPPLAATIPEGAELILLLASGNSPRLERNPHTGEVHWNQETALDLSVQVFHDADHPLELTLPRRRPE